MESEPLVSVITPTFNHEKYLGKCIDSVLAQTFGAWEQLIVDDGSTDGTPGIVARYRDDRIRYFRQENRGIWHLADNYNKALGESRGQYIAILEGDDLWPPDKLEKQIPAFDDGVVLSWGRAGITNSRDQLLSVSPGSRQHFTRLPKERALELLLTWELGPPACTVMCRRDALLRIGGFQQASYTPYVDYPTWLELGTVGDFRGIDVVLGYWRLHDRQITNQLADAMVKSNRYALEFYRKLPADLMGRLQVDEGQIIDNYDKLLAAHLLQWGRKSLSARRWEDARGHFREAFARGNGSHKVQALLGTALCYLKTDPEWIIPLLGRPRLDDRA